MVKGMLNVIVATTGVPPVPLQGRQENCGEASKSDHEL
jgi:hypothetical protein